VNRYNGPSAFGTAARYKGTNALNKIAPVTGGLKPDEIIFQQSIQDLKTPGQFNKVVQRWERNISYQY
jgi:hypothetical protein